VTVYFIVGSIISHRRLQLAVAPRRLAFELFLRWWFYPIFVILLNINLTKLMAKSQDARKEDKKKPVKTLKEKRAEKRDKKANKK